ncbi:kinase-like domain-containing protein [Xylaria grammica]|nr:kinase-like domain-containing protein [Xylaria grammica]
MQSPVRVADNEASDDGSRTNPHSHLSFAADTAYTTKPNDAPVPSVRFLTLSPDNELARQVTANSARLIMANSDKCKHQQQFLERVEIEADTHASDKSQAQVDDSAASQAQEPKYRFVFDLSVEPTGPHRSWQIGRGYTKSPDQGDAKSQVQGDSKLPVQGADILIRASRETYSAPTLALIWIHKQSGAFMLKAMSINCPIQYLSGLGSGRDLTLNNRDQTVLWLKRNRIRFGLKQLDFVLDIAIDGGKGEELFPIFRNRFLRSDGNDKALVPSDNLHPLPKDSHMRMHDFIVHNNMTGAGAFGVVKGAVNAFTGHPAAVKEVHITRDASIRFLKNEIEIVESLSHPSIIEFTKTWCIHENSPPCYASPLDSYFMVMPLAEYSFEDFFSPSASPPDRRTRLGLFRDIVEGLEYMHSSNIMHRDISPKNLLVMSDTERSPPWRGVICDFGKAVTRLYGSSTAIGPVHTVAPEVWTSSKGYTHAIDLWSLGYVHLYSLRRSELVRTDRKRIRTLLCLQGLLAIDPEQRLTAKEALEHPIWKTT